MPALTHTQRTLAKRVRVSFIYYRHSAAHARAIHLSQFVNLFINHLGV